MSKVVPADIIRGKVSDFDGVRAKEPSLAVRIEMVTLKETCDDPSDVPVGEPYICVQERPYMLVYEIRDEQRHPAKVLNLWEISVPIARKYLPSRIWWDDVQEAFVLLYYVSDALNLREFCAFDESAYLFAVELNPAVVYEYDIRARVFIDQVKVGEKMYCVFMFPESEWDFLISPKI